MKHWLFRCVTLLVAICLALIPSADSLAQELATEQANLPGYELTNLKVGRHDWPQLGGSSLRNNTPVGKNIPTAWDVGEFDRGTGRWLLEKARNIKWVASVGSQTYAGPVVANGKVFVGTNNGSGYVARYPRNVDLGCLLCFDEQSGEFLWQHSNEKLPTGRVHDWPLQGIVSMPVASRDRLWYVSNRGEVVCLDAAGFYDEENDGPEKSEIAGLHEADVVWRLDMMKTLGVSQHNLCTCSPSLADGVLFVVTSNGVDESHIHLPSPEAPSFLALDAATGKVLWSDNSPGRNILHGQWSSPSYAVLKGTPQVLFPGGDGWLYSFAPKGDGAGKSKLLWKFDCNPKTSKWETGGHGNRNEHITLPVIYDQKAYVAVGQDAEHGEGAGRLFCIDPTLHVDGSDVSPTLAFDPQGNRLAPRRGQNVDPDQGEFERRNPRSALVWEYDSADLDGDGKLELEEIMHRSCGPAAIKDGLVVIADFSGIVHLLDARTGQGYWTYDMLAACWAAAPLIVEDKIYITDEDGDVTIFALDRKRRILGEMNVGNSLYSTPVVANDVLFIASKTHLFAIAAPKKVER